MKRGWSKVWRVLLASFLICDGIFFMREASAHENIFGFSYTTETLPQGKWELEQVYQGRFGKHHGNYSNSFFRTELEYGFTDRFQGSVYVNSRYVRANKNNSDDPILAQDWRDDKVFRHKNIVDFFFALFGGAHR